MKRVALGVVAVLALVAACKKESKSGSSSPGVSTAKTPSMKQPITVHIAYSSEKKAWLEAAISDYKETHPQLQGRPIEIDAKSFGSGEAAQAILDGSFKATVFAPASSAYISLLDQQWQMSHP